MEEEIINLKQEIVELREIINTLIIKIDKLSGSAERMDTHIDFVEQTYTVLRTPIDYIRRQFDSSGSSLPKIEN